MIATKCAAHLMHPACWQRWRFRPRRVRIKHHVRVPRKLLAHGQTENLPVACRQHGVSIPEVESPRVAVRLSWRRPPLLGCRQDIAVTTRQRSPSRCFQSGLLPAYGPHGPLRRTSVSQVRQASRLALSHWPFEMPPAIGRLPEKGRAARRLRVLQ